MDHVLIRGIRQALDWVDEKPIGKEFAVGRLPDLDLCAQLLTPARLLDMVMRRSLAPHRLQCLVNGEFRHPQTYMTNSVAARGNVSPMADMDRLGALLRDGCTLVVDELNTYDPVMEVACRAMQWWTRELVQVNTYLTTGEAAGFNLHFDSHDVIIVQLAGEKSWEVRGTSRPVPMFRDAVPNTEPSEDVLWSGTLRAGEVMHIPRGHWHQATREDRGEDAAGYSLHATFGLTKRTGVDLFEWIADRSREHELFRHDLERGPSDGTQHHAFRELASQLINEKTVSEFVASREADRAPGRHVRTHGVFGAPSAAVCVAAFPPAVTHHRDSVDVTACGVTLDFAPEAAPALVSLLSGAPVHLAELTDATGVDADELAEVLISEGICAQLTPELEAGYRGLVTGAQPAA